jgi:ectoine hydroxylase-related dioxygenase (phytanoyl-CoA dioxygenase family)
MLRSDADDAYAKRAVADIETTGFHVVRGLFDEDEVEAITAESEELLQYHGGVDYADTLQRHLALAVDHRATHLQAALDDPRLWSIAAARLGPDALAAFPTVERYFSHTPWHRDALFPGTQGVKVLMYLEPLDANSGALRFAPGPYGGPEQPMPVGDADAPAVACETRPGDLIFFDPRIWHGSFHGGPRRRFASWTFWSNPTTEEQVFAMRSGMKRGVESFQKLGVKGLQSAEWITNADRSPLRAHWNNRIREMGLQDILRLGSGALADVERLIGHPVCAPTTLRVE